MMLSFISFWRAAAIVLNDLASSAFYAGGIAEKAVGRAAPWFILGVMLFSYAVRAIYVESCAMFTRGGVYRVVKEAMGGTLAKLSVSALMFDYILTGPISGVSAGQYVVGLIAQTVTFFGHPWNPSKDNANHVAAIIAMAVTIYFWWRNIKGIHASSDDALRIMKITTVMVVMMILWCGLTLLERGPHQLPPSPTTHNLEFSKDALGWMPEILPGAFREVPPRAPATEPHFGLAVDAGALIGLIGILIAFGHSVLAMSGEESLAQVYRELEHPKLKNLIRAGLVIFVYSLLFTSLVSFFASMIISDTERPGYYDNLISGLAMNVIGSLSLRLVFQAFVVMVGSLILSGAINTAIVGSNGVLNRVSEDGVLTDWFRAPHRKYGTSYRIINLIVILQLVTIIGSRGEVYVLGEAYAFGVIWSFAFIGLAMVVLRYKDKSPREWKVPGNIHLGKLEIPIGLVAIASALFLIAVINLFTKRVATISGIAFTAVFFVIFSISERLSARKHRDGSAALDEFNLNYESKVSLETVHARPGNLLVAVRDPNTLRHLDRVLEHTNIDDQDIVVITVRLIHGPHSGERDLYPEHLFTNHERKLFTAVVALAEKHGKPVKLMVIPSSNIFDAIAHTAVRLDSAEIVAGTSVKMGAQEQVRRLALAWERLPQKPRRQVRLRIIGAGDKEQTFDLEARPPRLSQDDINRLHKIWLRVNKLPGLRRIQHDEVIRVALNRLERDLGDESGVTPDFQKLDQTRRRENQRGNHKRDGGRQ